MALFFVTSGCSSLNPYKIGEKAITRYLADLLGPAERYRVHIVRDGTNLSRGYLSQMTVNATRLRTAGGILIDQLDADLYGVRFDRHKKLLNSIERSRFTGTLSQASANAYLTDHNRGIPGLWMEFKPDAIVIHAKPEVLGVGVPITLHGRSHAENGNLIRFEPDSLAISQLSLPQPVLRYVTHRIDPVFDLDDLKLPATLESVESQEGILLLHGQVKLSGVQ